ncbi:hypothetical protein [Adlercreutzia caecimuris]|uniref:hypothetical protein n=1 Tax=Adlercreutzia caecimuris TaxID=671266 RepID=UPI00249586AD|nr:hypothetical protein [Adlercreutzia caecimuris]
MATKTFSSRADAEQLAFAEALARQEYGMSFGQYCGTVLLGAIQQEGKMPDLPAKKAGTRKRQALAVIKGFSKRPHNAEVGKMTDGEIRELIASRYE